MSGSRPTSLATSSNSIPTPQDNNDDDDAYTVTTSRWSDPGIEDEPLPPLPSTAYPTTSAGSGHQPITRRADASRSPTHQEPQSPTALPSPTSPRYPQPPPIPEDTSVQQLARHSQTSFTNLSRPSTAGSRSHAPSLTSRAFYNPLSSQRLQAHRAQRPTSVAEQARRDSYESDFTEDRSLTNRNSTGSVLTTRASRHLQDRSDMEPMPPFPRETPAAHSPSNENMHVKRAILDDDDSRAGGNHSAESLDSSLDPRNSPEKSPRIDTQTPFSANKSPALDSKSQRSPKTDRSFMSNLRHSSKQDVSSEKPNRHIQQGNSDLEASKEKEKPKLGRNWEYFDGNTLFFFGGRFQTAKDKPVMAFTAVCVIVPACLFFGYS